MAQKILFVCKYNRFRSQIAGQFFKKYNQNKNFSASSAGIFRGRYPLNKIQVDEGRKFGIKIGKRPEGISSDLLARVDLVILVADDIPKKIFTHDKKYLQEVRIWKIRDEFHSDPNKIEHIIGNIEKKIKKLIRELESK
ncbi:MAG: hypothetical protein Q8P81_04325 [Nanoarchaeota archaeon]|nr:hypothetical protein [Nanoarchaeota archaeon]